MIMPDFLNEGFNFLIYLKNKTQKTFEILFKMWYNIGNKPCGIISAGKRVDKEQLRFMRLERKKRKG